MKKSLMVVVAAGLLSGISMNAKTLATVDGEAITDKEMSSMMRGMPFGSYEELPEEMKQQVLDRAIEKKLLLRKAKEEKIQETKAFQEALENIRDDIGLGVWMEQKLSSVKVTDAEIKTFYDKNIDRFTQPETIKARHILVASEEEAKSVIADLNKAGKKAKDKFIELANTKSTDKGAQSGGGDLGWFSKDQMVPEFSKAAFDLKAGAYTKTPVKTQFGYHVILVEERKKATVTPLKEAKEQITENLRMEHFREEVTTLVKELREKAKITIDK